MISEQAIPYEILSDSDQMGESAVDADSTVAGQLRQQLAGHPVKTEATDRRMTGKHSPSYGSRQLPSLPCRGAKSQRHDRNREEKHGPDEQEAAHASELYSR